MGDVSRGGLGLVNSGWLSLGKTKSYNSHSQIPGLRCFPFWIRERMLVGEYICILSALASMLRLVCTLHHLPTKTSWSEDGKRHPPALRARVPVLVARPNPITMLVFKEARRAAFITPLSREESSLLHISIPPPKTWRKCLII